MNSHTHSNNLSHSHITISDSSATNQSIAPPSIVNQNAITHSINQNGNPLKIAFWNSCGVGNKISELELYMRQESIQIMMIIETRVKPNSSILNVAGYHTYTASVPRFHRRGGVAIFVRADIRHTALQPIDEEFLQSAPIALLPANNSKNEIIIIAPIYCPPVYRWSPEQFTRLFKHFDGLTGLPSSRFILCGDWNAQHSWWGNPRACRRGKSLYDSIQSQIRYNVLATGGATHFPFDRRKRPSSIDFAVYAGIHSSHVRIRSTTDLDSDHLPLRVDLKTDSSQNFQTQYANPRLLPPRANTNQFQDYLAQNIHLNTEIRTSIDIDDAIDIFVRNINEAAAAASHNPRTPHINRPRNANRRSRHLELDEPTRSLLQEKRRCKRVLVDTRTPEARRQYRASQNKLKKALIKLKNRNINKLFEGIDTHDRYNMQKLWRLTNQLKRQPQPNFPIKVLTRNGTRDANPIVTWTKTTTDKAEAFAAHLEDRFSPIHSNSYEERLEIREECRQQKHLKQQQLLNGQQQTLRPITLNELKIEIDVLNLAKSPGEDRINNRIIKLLPEKALLYLLLIYNSMLRFEYFPHKWKHAGITLILKPGKNSSEASSYRPISLLSGLSKIFEKLLMQRLFEVEEFAKAVPSHQFGFRREHGTDHQLARVSQFILRAYEDKQFCSAVFIDVSEAFDRVWHDGLLCKLIKILPINLYNILESYLSQRTFTVNCNDGIKSRSGKVSAGVPQGSVLGPILYTIYSSDMPLPQLPQTHVNIRPHQNRMLLSTYADDTVIMCTSEVPAAAVCENQIYLRQFETWANKWSINPCFS